MKTCNRCCISKPHTEFYKKATAKDGLFWWCRSCHKEKMAAKYHELAKNEEYRAAERRRINLFWRDNPEKRAQADRKYRSNNQAKVNAKLKKRYAAQLNRTPKWLSEDDFWVIEQAYELAQLRTQMTGFVWHVDHVLPLQGRLVSGLHVPHNLQVIPAWDNRSKSNSFTTT
jgi:hypothetical protein